MFSSKTIMIVDDDREIRDIARLRLTAAGYTVTFAVDGQDMLDNVASHRPDAIIMDLRMPRKDGMSALIELRSRFDVRHIPVIMVSASAIEERRALDAGARFFLAKPYIATHLLAAIHVSVTKPARELNDHA